jgi:ABC-type sugar transport system substrate-binding protein
MQRMKRRLASSVMAAAAGAGVFVAVLGSSTTGASAAAKVASAGKLKSILFVNPLPDQSQWKEIGVCMKAQAKKEGVPYSEVGEPAGSTPTQMIQEIQTGIADKVGAIVTFPASAAFTPVLAQAKKAGIVTGTMYGGGGGATGEFNTGTNWTSLGAAYASAVVARKGQQNVGMITQAPSGDGLAFVNGFKKAAKKYKNVTVVSTIYTNDSPTTAQSEVSSLLLAHPTINVLASNESTATQPVISDVKSANDVGKVVLEALGSGSGGVQGAKDGIVYRMLLQDLCTEGKNAAQAAANVAAGKPGPAQISVQFAMVGLKGYKKYTAKGWS